jgi:hypothetical protein
MESGALIVSYLYLEWLHHLSFSHNVWRCYFDLRKDSSLNFLRRIEDVGVSLSDRNGKYTFNFDSLLRVLLLGDASSLSEESIFRFSCKDLGSFYDFSNILKLASGVLNGAKN